MNFLKFSIELLILQSIAAIGSAELKFSGSKESSEIIVQAAVKIVKNCYESRTSAIGIGGNSPDSLVTGLSTGEYAVVLMSSAERIVKSGPISRNSLYKLKIFAIAVSSSSELDAVLKKIKSTRWWNHMAHIYIIDWPISENGCSKAREILSTAWRMNLLEAKFMCVNDTGGALIYSFNPYTSDAPDPWKLENTYRAGNDHPWALLWREYRDDYCENMNFDKTKNLGGHEIRAAYESQIANKNFNAKGRRKTLYNELFPSMIHRLNGTVKFISEKSSFSIRGMLKEEKSDIVVDPVTLCYPTEAFAITYSFLIQELHIVTRYPSYKTQFDKMVTIMDRNTSIGVCLVTVVTVIFIKYLFNENITASMLNTARFVFNSGLVKSPISVGSRIYVSALLAFVVTMTAIYQGQLVALLSRRVIPPKIDSIGDLVKSNHTIYGDYFFYTVFDSGPFRGRYVKHSSNNYCSKYMLSSTREAACILPIFGAIPQAAASKLYLSKEPITITHMCWLMRADWPLEDRINIMIQRLVKANLQRYSLERSFEGSLRAIEKRKHEEENDDRVRVLTLSELNLAFVILGVGLGSATVSFVIEIEAHLIVATVENIRRLYWKT